jgi:NAD(P)-dependent dehydrogenase (short-subunit alcohol dehydrogenase family)
VVDEAWSHGVTVNTVAPGPVSQISSLEQAIALSKHDKSWLHRKDVSPQDIAEGVAFLCSDRARYITGCVMPFLFNMK